MECGQSVDQSLVSDGAVPYPDRRSAMLSLVCLLFLSSDLFAEASKVLFLPMMGKSPYFVTKAVADEMAGRGHEVRCIEAQLYH